MVNLGWPVLSLLPLQLGNNLLVWLPQVREEPSCLYELHGRPLCLGPKSYLEVNLVFSVKNR